VKSKNTWKTSSIEVNKAALLLSEEWVTKNVPKFGVKEESDLDEVMAPPIFLLNDEEKFKDAQGNVIEIEVRGERHHDKILFYGKDIERMLEMKRLRVVLTQDDSTYEEGEHYKKFIRSQSYITRNNLKYVAITSDQIKHNEDKNNKHDSVLSDLKHVAIASGQIKHNEDKNNKHDSVLSDLKHVAITSDIEQSRACYFLTYIGLIKLLLSRKHTVAKTFQKWATNILFTNHLGTVEQKEELSAKLIGSSVESVRDFLSSSPSKYSEIYLICIGKASDLKESLPILSSYSDNDLVFKYGYTDDLSRRLQEHKKHFSKIKGTNISVVLHSPIDPKFLSKAEKDLKDYFQDVEEAQIQHPVYKELVVVSEKRVNKIVKSVFNDICVTYAGSMEKIQNEINRLKSEFEKEKKAREKEFEVETRIKETETKMREKEFEVETRIKEIEMKMREKALEKEVENEKKSRTENRLEFISFTETMKKEHGENLENMERKNKEMLDYLMSSLKQMISIK